MHSPQPLTEEEFRKIIDEIMKIKPYTKDIKRQLFCSWRDATMLWFHYYLGLRPRTVRLIKIKHIDFRKKILFVPADNVKIRTADSFPIPKQLYEKLLVYLKIRNFFFKGNSYLFFPIYSPNKPQDKNYLGERVRKVLKKLNISQESWIDKAGMNHYNKCLYSIRHSYGLRVWQKTKNIKFVAIMLGHHDIMMRHAWRYVSIFEDNERGDIMRQVWEDEEIEEDIQKLMNKFYNEKPIMLSKFAEKQAI